MSIAKGTGDATADTLFDDAMRDAHLANQRAEFAELVAHELREKANAYSFTLRTILSRDRTHVSVTALQRLSGWNCRSSQQVVDMLNADIQAMTGEAPEADSKTPRDDEWVLQDSRAVTGNCLMFWRKGRSGYTCDLSQAHIFTMKEVVELASARTSDVPRRLSDMRQIAAAHVDHQRLRYLVEHEAQKGPEAGDV